MRAVFVLDTQGSGSKGMQSNEAEVVICDDARRVRGTPERAAFGKMQRHARDSHKYILFLVLVQLHVPAVINF